MCIKDFEGADDKVVAMVPDILPATSVQQDSAAPGEEAAAEGTGIVEAPPSSATAMAPSLQRAAGGEGVGIDVVPSAERTAAEGEVTHEAHIAQPRVQQVRPSVLPQVLPQLCSLTTIEKYSDHVTPKSWVQILANNFRNDNFSL